MQLLNYQNSIHGPQDLSQLSFSRDYRPFKKTQIYDEDGDGVEDNVHKTQDELDRFRKMVFSSSVEDMHNTRNGELPGHHLAGDHPEPKSAGGDVDDFNVMQVTSDLNGERSMNEGDASYLQLNVHQTSFADMVS